MIGYLPEIMDGLRQFYTDRVSILYAIEHNESGRVCRDWVCVPDPCDNSQVMSDLPAQFRYNPSRRDDVGQRERVTQGATVDLPTAYPWITESMRVQHGTKQWRIVSVTNDLGIATRLELEAITQ